MGPHRSLVIGHFLRDLIEIDFFISLTEQTMTAQLLHAGALGHIRNQTGDVLGPVGVSFHEGVEERGGVAFARLLKIVAVLQIIFRLRRGFQKFLDQPPLTNGGRRVIDSNRNLFHALPGSHIPKQLSHIGAGGIFEVPAGDNDLRHQYSSSSSPC